MNFDELTEAQREALQISPRARNVYESSDRLTDFTTGEIIQSHHKTVTKTSTEPDYIKVYYKTMLAFADAEGIPLDFVLAIASYITWSNNGLDMRYKNDKPNREEICSTLNIKDGMYKRYLKRCVECGLLFLSKYRGCYDVNPFFIAKGKWESIQKLQMTMDFVSGKWIRGISQPEQLDAFNPNATQNDDDEENRQDQN